MKKSIRLGVAVVVLLGGVMVGTSSAQTDLSKFPLTKAVPADAFITVAGRGNPERKFLEVYWAEVGRTFMDSGILEDIWDLVTASAPDEDVDQIEDAKEQLSELLKGVSWGELFSKEMIFTGRFRSLAGSRGLTFEGVLIGRLDEKQAASNFAGLKAVMEEIVKLIGTHAGEDVVALQESKENGVSLVSLRPADEPMSVLTLAQTEDLILISFGGDTILRDALALLKGTAKKPCLAESPRFKKAFAELPPAEDTLVFWDIEGMLNPMRTIFGEVAAKKPAGSRPAADDEGESDEAQPWLNLAATVLDDVSILDYMASVEWTDGYRVFSETVTVVRPEAKGRPLYEILTANKPLQDWEKFIPKEAEDFSCTSGVNLSKLYRYAVGFIKKNVPDGKEAIAQLDKLQEQWELDIDKDVLSLFTGQMISAKMGQRQFIMLKVADEKKANAQVARLVKKIKETLGKESPLLISDVKVAGEEGFTQFSHPLLLMVGGLQPVVGCADGYLIFGTSTDAVSTCLETARGKHDNITKNERWRKEALQPKSGGVDTIAFTDEANMGEELQSMIGMLSMGLNLATLGQGLPPEVRKVISTVAPLLGKLSPVLGKLDFYQSSAGYSTFDGKQWRQREVQNYKTPQPKSPGEEKGESDAAPKKTGESDKPKARGDDDAKGEKAPGDDDAKGKKARGESKPKH